MNWFERHLNLSLFLGLLYIPVNVSFSVSLVAFVIMFIIAAIKSGIPFNWMALLMILMQDGIMAENNRTLLAIIVLITVVLLVLALTWWFLGRKGRSKIFLLLFLVSWVIGVVGYLNTDSAFSVFFFAGFFIFYKSNN